MSGGQGIRVRLGERPYEGDWRLSPPLLRVLARLGLPLILTVVLVGALGALLGGISQPSPAWATPGILYVHPTCSGAPSPCYTDIQDAVDAASPGDEVRIAQGTYTGVQQRNGITQVVYIAKDLTLLGGWSEDFSLRKPSAFPTVIDAQGLGRAVALSGPVEVTLNGLEITGGDARGLGGLIMGYTEVDVGGGLYVYTATAVLSDCRVYDNVASHEPGAGGGIGADGGRLLIHGGEIYSNSATIGGGIYAQHNTLILTDTLVHHNVTTVTEYYIGSGGGIAISGGVMTGTRLVLAGNESVADGGGLSVDGGAIRLEEAEVHENRAAYNGGNGGGIALKDASAVVTATEVYSNTAGQYGGGIYLLGGFLTVEGCEVHHNVTGDNGSGGGMYLSPGGQVRIEHSDIHHNRAGSGGGVKILGKRFLLFRWNRIYENRATTWGCGGVSDEGGSLWFRDGNLILRNQAVTYGGGLCLWSSTNYWRNTVVAGNVLSQSDGHGAGVYLAPYGDPGIEVSLFHMTLADNAGGTGEGLAAMGNVRAWLTNTIVAGHTTGVWAADGSTITLEATLWHGNGAETGGPGTVVTAGPDLYGDPRFAAPEEGDYRLRPDSAAIDAGVDAGVHRDLEMDPRPSGSGYDIGADEYECHAVEGAKIVGAEEGPVGLYTFTAEPAPLEALPPFTYTWQPEPDAGQGTSEAVYSWALPGTYAITVTVENCGGYVQATHTITIYTPAYGVSLTPSARSAQATPGDTVVYTHTLRNTGETPDTYTVTVSSTQDWAVLRSPGTVSLAPEATAVVTVEVSVPAMIPGGVEDVAMVRATSWATPTVQAEAVDTTTVRHLLWLPLVLRNR